MSQHNIIGSEAFDRSPSVQIRSVKTGGMRRRQMRTALAFVAGGAVTVIAAVVAAAIAFGPSITGS